MNTVEIKVNLNELSSVIDSLAVLAFVAWLITITNVFGLSQYSLFFFGISLFFACVSPIVKQITEKNGIRNISMLIGIYFFVLGAFLALHWVNGEEWVPVLQVIEALFIIGLGLTAATPKYPRYVKNFLSKIGWILIILANLVGSVWFLVVIDNPYIGIIAEFIHRNSMYSVTGVLFFSATGLLFVGWILYQTKYKERIKYLRSVSEILLLYPMGITLVIVLSSVIWSVFWLQLQRFGQFLALTFLIGLIAYGSLSTVKSTSYDVEKELSKQISKGVEMRLENVYQNQYKDLGIQEIILQVNTDVTLAQTDIVTFKIFAGAYMVPIIKNGKSIGGVFFGKGYYRINAKYRTYESNFDGDALVVAHEDLWNQIVTKGRITPPYQPVSNPKVIIESAVKKLEKFSTWTPTKRTYPREKSGDKVSIHLPFFHMDVDDSKDFVDIRIGPIKIKSEGEKSYVRVGPFLAIDDVANTIKTSNINAMITEETGEDIYFAVSKNKVILKHGTADIYIKPNKIVIFDKNIKVYSTEQSLLISSPVLKMVYKRGRSLKLKTENAHLKVYADTGLIKFTNAKIIKLKDVELAKKILNMIEEISGDFVREVLEKGTLESFSDFISNLEF